MFCNQTLITHQKNNLPDAAAIVSTIEEYLSYRGQRKWVELAFFGGNFLGLSPAMVTCFLDSVMPYIENKKIDGIRFSTRPDTIDSQNLDLIDPYPVSAVELGVQSMIDAVLTASNRGHTAKDTINAIDLLKKRGHKVGVQLMVGLPGDGEVSLLKSTQQIVDLNPDFARIYPLLVLSGSPLAVKYKKGDYTPLCLDQSIVLVKQMMAIFNRADIPVIRLGLQASDMMSDETQVLAGPWHPAFGHLVFSQMLYDAVIRQLETGQDILNSNHLFLRVHPCAESRLRGDKNENLERLSRLFPKIKFIIVKDNDLAITQVKVDKAKGQGKRI
ncbi:MAG: radical SAM protein [Desulfobacula sp.]|nr:radical SAM protein [Desulfobacula sp.]